MANLKISQLPSASATTSDLLAVVNNGTTKKITINDIVGLVPATPFTGNTSGDCISDIYVSNIHSCSPVQFFDNQTPLLSIDSINGFTLVEGINMVVPDGSGINDSDGNTLLDGKSTTNTYNSNSSTGFATNYWENNLYESSISGTSTATTATTVFRTSQNIEEGLQIFEINNINGGLVYQTSTGGGSGCPGCESSSDCGSPSGRIIGDCVNGCCTNSRWTSEVFGIEGSTDIELVKQVDTDSIYFSEGFVDGSGYDFTNIQDFSTGYKTESIFDSNGNSLYQSRIGACVFVMSKYEEFSIVDGNDTYISTIPTNDSLIEERGISTTGVTGSTVFRTNYDMGSGINEFSVLNDSGTQLYQTSTGGGGGCPGCNSSADCGSPSGRIIGDCVGGCCTNSRWVSEVFGIEGSTDIELVKQVDTDSIRYSEGFVDGSGYEFKQINNYLTGQVINTLENPTNRLQKVVDVRDVGNLGYSQSVSGTSTATTATTVFRTSYNIEDGIESKEIWDHTGVQLYQATVSATGGGCDNSCTNDSECQSGSIWNEAKCTDGCCVASLSSSQTFFKEGSSDVFDGVYAGVDTLVSGQFLVDGTGTEFVTEQNFATGIESKTTLVTKTGGNPYVTGSVSVVSVNVDEATTTYRLIATPIDGSDVLNTYSIYGSEDNPMILPASYQEVAPFGTNIGGVPPAIIAAIPSAAFDGWLTIGITDGDVGLDLGEIGIDWNSWTASAGLTSTSGSVFWQNPDDGPSGAVVVAQVTIPTGTSFDAYMNLQGRSSVGGGWQAEGVLFAINSDTVAENVSNTYETSTNYSDSGLAITNSLSGASTATTATTVFSTVYDIEAGSQVDSINGTDVISFQEGLVGVVGNIKMVDGNQALNKVLTSDANGVGTWQAPSFQSLEDVINVDGTATVTSPVSIDVNEGSASRSTLTMNGSLTLLGQKNPLLGYPSAKVQMANNALILQTQQTSNGSQIRQIVMGDTGMIISDGQLNKGFVYAADYSANFTDNSLVSKKYVDDATSAPTYTIFTAVITDFGFVGDPQMTILENTLGFTPTISYEGTGSFRINQEEGFPIGYTTSVFGPLQGLNYVNKVGAPSGDYVNWSTSADGQMLNMTVEIKVFTPTE
jgi:hypothetical protein